MEMIKKLPTLNGPYSRDEDEEHPRVTDYSVGQSVIYCAFGWSQAKIALKHVFCTAQKYRLGIVESSVSDAIVWLPNSKGRLERASW
jgi:hypothetical protein